jgi:hypothetical protein
MPVADHGDGREDIGPPDLVALHTKTGASKRRFFRNLKPE